MRDLSDHLGDLAGQNLSDESFARIAALDTKTLRAVDPSVRIGPCVGHVGKFIGIGLNYADHAAEAGLDVPAEPILFTKYTSAICGPHDDLIIPRNSDRTDWEVELAVMIGKRASYVEEADALSHVAGYCVANDVSERGFQFDHGGQWVKANRPIHLAR